MNKHAQNLLDLAEVNLWIPPGEWYNTALGEFCRGAAWQSRAYTLSETPVFVRAGALIPGSGHSLQ